MSGPDAREWGALETVRHGWRHSPDLHHGIRLTLALALAGTAGRLVVPVLVQQAIDKGLKPGHVDVALVVRLAVIGAAVILVATVANRTAVVRLARRSEHALYALRRDVFAHVHQLSLADQAEERRGALVARVTSDIETLSQFFSWGGLMWLLDGMLMVVVAVLMYVYDPLLATVTIVVSSPLFYALRVLQGRLIRAYGHTREANAGMLTSLSELVMGAAVVRAYGVEEPARARVDASTADLRKRGIAAATLSALLFPTGEVFSVLTIASVVVIGVARGTGSGLTTGALVGFVFLAYRFLEPIAEFTDILDQTQTAVAGWRRVLALLETPVEVPEPVAGRDLPPGPPSIDVDGVSFVYRRRDPDSAPEPEGSGTEPIWALRSVGFHIEPATSVAVVGATGSGKSTLAKLLTRLADPTEGAVRVAGIDLREVAAASLRKVLVMVPQEPFLFDTTIEENVRFARPDATADDVWLAFAELGLDGWLETLEDGLATRVGERGEHLSAGERQLVALARAYADNPACLVLDEATSAVDPGTEARLARALESLARGRTSITIAHRLSTAARADRILVFDAGRLVEQGAHAELVAMGGFYAALHASWLDATAAGSAAVLD